MLAPLKELWVSSPSLDSCWASWLQEAQEPNKTTVEMLEVRGLSTEHVLQSTLCLVGPRKAASRLLRLRSLGRCCAAVAWHAGALENGAVDLGGVCIAAALCARWAARESVR